MRCPLSVLLVGVVIANLACTEPVKKGNSTVANTSSANDAAYKKGLELVAASDCFSCHQIRDLGAGPSYQSIADKYINTTVQIQQLAQKIVKGGSGVWGTVPMPPHPQITNEDAEAMVQYILLLKK
jgi:cytochrome c